MKFEPWNTGSRVKAVVGHYGSGKTEFSLNMALAARRAGRKATVVDLDIVNPFFRSAEQGERLARAGVRLIAPPFALTGVDVPALGAEVLSVFQEDSFAVLDVGGDDAGAAALGRFHPEMERVKAEVYYVVNPFRPFSGTKAQVLDMMRRIEFRGKTHITGLVNNANLAQYTTEEELLRGRALLEEVSKDSGVPVVCECRMENTLDLPEEIPVLAMERLLMPEWLLQC